MISYFYLEQDLSGMDAQTAALLLAFVQFVLSDEGQAKAEENLFVKLPQELQDYNAATLASLVLPADYVALSFEDAGETLVEVGAAGTVISGKRQSYDNWAIARLQSDVKEILTRLQVCESQGVHMLHGAGTTNPSKLFWELLGLVQARAKFAVHATYRAVGSSTGQKEFLGASNGNKALNHFGSGDIPMTAERYSAVVDAGRTMVHVPFALGGIGVFHSAPVGGASVHLTACVLAKIFSVQITTWDDPEIEALNPDVALPTLPIKVVHRVKGSSSTAGFVEYLEATCPASWSLGTGSSLDTWPASTAGAQGSGGMSQYIEETAGAIGYVDAGHGHERGLSEVALRNMDGVYLTTNEADIGAAATVALDQGGLIPLNATADWSAVNLYNLAGPTTYPITMISYFYLEQDLSGMDAQTAALLLAFVQFVLSDEGQAKAEENLFVKLPQELQDYNAATLASLVLPADYVALSFEDAGETPVEVGAAGTVISGKRQSYDNWAIARLQSDVKEILTRLQVCESQGVHMLHGAGTTNPSKLFWELLGLVQARAKFAVHATYRAV